MHKKILLAGTISLSFAASHPAWAHVDYGNLDAFPIQTNTFSRTGWFRGTDTPATGCGLDGTPECLGDSHNLQFFKFTLIKDSTVTISFASNQNGLDPAFSLYRGLLPDEAHDDSATDPKNALDGNFNPVPHPTDSAYWNSNDIREGQFNAFGTWSMANDSEEWAEIQFLTHKNDSFASTPGSAEILATYFLNAGSYTVAAAGATNAGTDALLSGTVSFSASPVPLPSAIWLMGSTLAGLGVFSRHRSRQDSR